MAYSNQKKNKKNGTARKIFIATFGGIDSVFGIATPLFILLLWIRAFGWGGLGSYTMFFVCVFSLIYRSIKIGLLKL